MKSIDEITTPYGNNQRTQTFDKEFTLECVMTAQRTYDELIGKPDDGEYPTGNILQLATVVAISRLATVVKFTKNEQKR